MSANKQYLGKISFSLMFVFHVTLYLKLYAKYSHTNKGNVPSSPTRLMNFKALQLLHIL